MQSENYTVSNTLKRFYSFRYMLIFEGIVVGALSGLVVVMFRVLLEKAEILLNAALAFGKANTWFVPVWFGVLFGVACLVSALLKWEPYISGSGIPQIEGEMQGSIKQTWWKVLSAKLAGGLLSIGSGLSLGREGPSIQLGAMTAKGFARLTKRMKTEERLLMTCGASAGLSAAFNAPIAGILFALEEIHKNFSPEVLLSSMASSIVANFVSRNVFGLEPVFTFHVPYMMPLGQYGHVVLLGIILGFLGVLYNNSIRLSQNLYARIKQRTVRLLIPFMLAGVLGFLYPMAIGGGHPLVHQLTVSHFAVGTLTFLFIVKFCFSMVSFGSGAPGGIFLPLLVMGAIVGNLYNTMVSGGAGSLDELLGNFIILGMAGYFSAIVRAPMTGIILISEMTGTFSHLLTLCIVSLLAYLVPDMMKCKPIYDQLLERILEKQKKEGKESGRQEPSGEKVLVNGMIYHGSFAEGKKVSDIVWPQRCLVVSLMRGETEFIPKGDSRFRAGDRILLLCDEEDAPGVHEIIEEKCQNMKEGSE